MSQDLHESNAEIETIAPPEPPKPAKEWVFTFESLAQKSLSYFFMNEGDNQAEEIENNIGFEDSILLPTTSPSPPSAPVETSDPVNVKVIIESNEYSLKCRTLCQNRESQKAKVH